MIAIDTIIDKTAIGHPTRLFHQHIYWILKCKLGNPKKRMQICQLWMRLQL